MKNSFFHLGLFLGLLLCLVIPSHADDRVALVIGNKDYKVGGLANPLNDAQDMALVLKELGFSVEIVENGNQRDMGLAIDAFSELSRGAKVVLFYYAGHGKQYENLNYMLPIGSMRDIKVASDVKYKAVPVEQVMERLNHYASSAQKIIILDACRDNSLPSDYRSGTSGLASMWAPTGTVIAYATKPGGVSSDNSSGRNGLFTKHLLRHIAIPGKSFTEVLLKTRQGVVAETDGSQQPWEHSSLLKMVYLNGEPVLQDDESQHLSRSGKGIRVFIRTRPENATVEIMNVPVKYFQGMPLQKGKYHFRISADGYKPGNFWAELKGSDKHWSFDRLKPEQDIAGLHPDLRLKRKFLNLGEGGRWKDSSGMYSSKMILLKNKKWLEAVEDFSISPDGNRIAVFRFSGGLAFMNRAPFLELTKSMLSIVTIQSDGRGNHLNEMFFVSDKMSSKKWTWKTLILASDLEWVDNDTFRFHASQYEGEGFTLGGKHGKADKYNYVRVNEVNEIVSITQDK